LAFVELAQGVSRIQLLQSRCRSHDERLSHVLTNYYLQLQQSISDPSLMVQTLPLLVLLVLVNVYILFKIPTMTHSLFTGTTGGHGGGLGVAMMAIRAAM
jgi:hypothetical protein